MTYGAYGVQDLSDAGTGTGTDKTERIRIRCTPEILRRFKVFVASYGFKTQMDAMRALLDVAEKNLESPKTKWG